MKKKLNKKIVSGILISLVSSQMMQAVAQGVSTQPALSTSAPTIQGLPNIAILDVNGAPAECNREIMQNLNTGYIRTRGTARILQYNNQMNGLVLTTPKANQMDCFQQAMQNIKNLMGAINSILAMFSGKIDMDAIMQQMVNMVLKAACQEINQVTGSISGSLNTMTGGINSTINTVNSVTGTPIGSTGTSIGTILSPSTTGSTNIVSGTAAGVSGTLVGAGSLAGAINSFNPFGSNP